MEQPSRHSNPLIVQVPRPLSDGELHQYKLNDTHFNARGNAVAGHALADFLARWPRRSGAAGAAPSE